MKRERRSWRVEYRNPHDLRWITARWPLNSTRLHGSTTPKPSIASLWNNLWITLDPQTHVWLRSSQGRAVATVKSLSPEGQAFPWLIPHRRVSLGAVLQG